MDEVVVTADRDGGGVLQFSLVCPEGVAAGVEARLLVDQVSFKPVV